MSQRRRGNLPAQHKTSGLLRTARNLGLMVVGGVMVGLILLGIEYKSGHFANAASPSAPPQTTSARGSPERAAQEQQRSEKVHQQLARAEEDLVQARREAAEAVQSAAAAGQRLEALEKKNAQLESELAQQRETLAGMRAGPPKGSLGTEQRLIPQARASVVYYRCPSQEIKQLATEEAHELTALMTRLGIRVVRGREYFASGGKGYTAVAYGPLRTWGQWRLENDKQAQAMLSRLRACGLEAQLERPEAIP